MTIVRLSPTARALRRSIDDVSARTPPYWPPRVLTSSYPRHVGTRIKLSGIPGQSHDGIQNRLRHIIVYIAIAQFVLGYPCQYIAILSRIAGSGIVKSRTLNQ